MLRTIIAAVAMLLGTGAAFAGGSDDAMRRVLDADSLGDYETVLSIVLPMAKEGNPDAQFRLARLYEHGDAVKQDYKKAAHWMEMAAMKDNVQAQSELGRYCLEGLVDGHPDFDKAERWLEKAAAKNFHDAQYQLGRLWKQKGDQEKAAYWWTKAAEERHDKAQFELGLLYKNGLGVKKDLKEARKWLTMADINGNPEAAAALKELPNQ